MPCVPLANENATISQNQTPVRIVRRVINPIVGIVAKRCGRVHFAPVR